MRAPLKNVHDILRSLQTAIVRRAALEGGATGLAVGAAVLVGVAAVLAWAPVPPERASAVRVVGLALGALALLGPSAVAAWVARRRFGSAAALAAHVERLEPSLRTDVRTALEFERSGWSADDVAASLRRALVARVDDAARALRPRLSVFVLRRNVRLRLAAAAAAGALALLGSLGSESFSAGVRALAFGVPDAAPGDALATEPLVGTLDYEVIAPDYARRPPSRAYGATGNLRALVGSDIVFEARTLVPTAEAVLRLDVAGQTTRTQLRVVDGERVQGRFTVRADATWRFELTTPDGRRLVDPIPREVKAIPDAAPTVDLSEPGDSLEVTPDQVVDLQYVARDDFGLSSVSVLWYFAGDSARVRELPLQGALGVTTFEEHVPFDLRPLHLQPRDEVVVFVQAVDNDAFSGAKSGRSRAVTLRVASPDDRHGEVLAMKEELFEALLGRLGAVLAIGLNGHELDGAGAVALVPAPGTGSELAERITAARTAHAAWTPTIELFERLLQAMDEDTLSIDADRQLLRGAYDRLYTALLDEGRALEKFTDDALRAGVTAAEYQPAAARAADTIRTTERTVLVLQDLVATHRADDVQRAMEELDDVRARLRELLEEYRDTRDPELRASIERELRRLQQRMNELLSRLASQIENLPVEHLNADAIEPSELAENVGQMQSAMEQLRQMLDAGDIDAALSLLDQLEADLDSMGQELQPLGDSQPQTLSEFDQAMGELMDQLNDLEAQEQELEQQTQELLDEMLAERAAQMREQTERALAEAEQLVQDMQRRMAELGDDRLSQETVQTMRRTEEGLELLRQRLASEDVAGAESVATRLLSQISDMDWEIRRDASMMVRDAQGRQQAEQAQQTSRRVEAGTRQVRRAMQELMDAAQPDPNASQQARMRELGQRQGQVRQRLGQMQQQASEMGERFPMVGESLDPMFEQAGEHMDGAAQNLRRSQPRQALQGEHSALESMQQMRQQMRQLTQRQRQREQREGGRQNPDQRVDVPEDGESGRVEFRRRVIESMRDESLDAYEQEIRQYYERLLE